MTWIVKTKPQCPWCVRAKELLKEREIEFVEQTHETLLEIGAFKNAGFKTFPQIFNKSQHIGGYTDLVTYFENIDGF